MSDNDNTLFRIEQLLIEQLQHQVRANEILAYSKALLSIIKEKVMSTIPVTQAQFDTALATFNAAFASLTTALQSLVTGLSNVEASLAAALANPGTVDLTGELATIQNLQSESATALAEAQTAISGIPAPDQPTLTSATAQAQAQKAAAQVKK